MFNKSSLTFAACFNASMVLSFSSNCALYKSTLWEGLNAPGLNLVEEVNFEDESWKNKNQSLTCLDFN